MVAVRERQHRYLQAAHRNVYQTVDEHILPYPDLYRRPQRDDLPPDTRARSTLQPGWFVLVDRQVEEEEEKEEEEEEEYDDDVADYPDESVPNEFIDATVTPVCELEQASSSDDDCDVPGTTSVHSTTTDE